MTDNTYALLEQYMLSCMTDSAHDKEHIYRVLYTALDIAGTEQDVDYDVLICACLLHDIGRQEQFEDPSLNHAEVGADKAFAFLSKHGFSEDFTHRVCDCIRSHRYRKRNPPSRQRFCLTRISWMRAARSESPGPCSIRESPANRFIRLRRIGPCLTGQTIPNRHFFRNISISWNPSTIIFSQKEALRSEKNDRMPQKIIIKTFYRKCVPCMRITPQSWQLISVGMTECRNKKRYGL